MAAEQLMKPDVQGFTQAADVPLVGFQHRPGLGISLKNLVEMLYHLG